MARDILVHSSGSSSEAVFFSAVLGSEASVREYWSNPAEQLGLVLIASIYEQGFYEGISWSGGELDAVERELDCLENYWITQNYGVDLAAQLGERCQSLREALRIAKGLGCVLSIS